MAKPLLARDLNVDVRGLTTSLIPDGSGIQIDFDLVDHLVIGRSTDGKRAVLPLKEGTVAEFKARFADLVASLGGTPHFSDLPSEVPDPVRFSQDTRPRPYDADAVARYFRALVLVDSVYKTYRTGFIGKSSPVHLFWGAMDLAVTRFSGGAAPMHPGNIPGLPDAVTRDAYDHQCASAGFWPGGIGSSEASFYAYTYPVVEGYPAIEVSPGEAVWDTTWGNSCSHMKRSGGRRTLQPPS
ncbi:DUF5996 family protein [Mesorhizobium sp. J428]|nr:DUF5996 family protein [Mesorhizobium sp. J428]MCR5856408.1 DUF5996 family protein [Mesorhizobium sp. J428]